MPSPIKLHSIYDAGPDWADRCTLFTMNMATATQRECLCLGDDPTSPQGFSQFNSGTPGKHCGKRIRFNQLPENVQRHAIARLTPE